MKRILAVTHKELIHLVRDKRTIYLAFFIPVVIMLLIGYSINFDVDHIRMAVYDKCKDSKSRELVSRLVYSGYFHISYSISQEEDVLDVLDHGKAALVLVIPSDYSKKIMRGEKSVFQVLVDASDNFTASIVGGYIIPIVNQLSTETITQFMNQKGKKSLLKTLPIESRDRIIFNPNLKSRLTIVPALIAFIMMVISTFLISMTIAKEWEAGTIEQLFASPIKGYELILGKFILYFILMLIQCFILWLVAHYYFEVPFKSDWFDFMIICSLFLISTVGIGLLISVAAKSLLVSMQMAALFSLFPSLLLSGFIYPIKSMPDVLQPLSYILPATYFIECLRSLFLKDTPMEFLIKEAVVFTVIGILVLLIVIKKFKKRITAE